MAAPGKRMLCTRRKLSLQAASAKLDEALEKSTSNDDDSDGSASLFSSSSEDSWTPLPADSSDWDSDLSEDSKCDDIPSKNRKGKIYSTGCLPTGLATVAATPKRSDTATPRPSSAATPETSAASGSGPATVAATPERSGPATLSSSGARTSGTSGTAAPETPDASVKRGRKRQRNPAAWKRNINKRKKLCGEEYVGHKGRVKAKITEGPPCNCKKHIDAANREHLRCSYYSMPDRTAQRYFLAGCIKSSKPKRSYSQKNKREFTFQYFLTVNSQKVNICKQALASILGIKIAQINYTCDLIKSNSTPHQFSSGKHHNRPNKISEIRRQHVLDFIDRVPKYRSHYTRKHNPHRHYLSPSLTQSKLFDLYAAHCANEAVEPVTSRMFSEIFTKDRNLHFGQPSLDTCKTCDKLEMNRLASPNDQSITAERELHLRKAEAGQLALRRDFEKAKQNEQIWTIAFDFQQTLPTPHINTSVTFYSRQLWTYNFGLHDIQNGTMHMWSENTAGRGSSEVLSCLNQYFLNKKIPEATTHLNAWSDSCGGQNKNKNIIAFWYYLVHVKKRFKTVEHKFPIPGHTFLPCDRDFGIIEKKKRRTPAVYNPEGWCKLVEQAKPSDPFTVVRMNQKQFVDISPMKSKLVFRTTAVDGSKVRLQKATCFKIDSEKPSRLYMKYNVNYDEEWQEVNIAQAGPLQNSLFLPQLYDGSRQIAPAKLKDLKQLCTFIPVEYRAFYTSLETRNPSPCKLRKGRVLKRSTPKDGSDSDIDSVEEPSTSSDSDSD